MSPTWRGVKSLGVAAVVMVDEGGVDVKIRPGEPLIYADEVEVIVNINVIEHL
jgi:hypothetical protein